MHKVERKCKDFLTEHFIWFALFAVFVAGVVMRWTLLPFSSGDLEAFNVPWMNEMRRYGGNAMVEEGRFNYSPLFFYVFKIVGDVLVGVLTPEMACKVISLLPEIPLCLMSIVALNKMAGSPQEKVGLHTLVIAIAFWLNPLILFNAAAWGQTDCYYVLFSLLAVWLMMQEQPVWALCALGISCSWKLQGVFLVPWVILMYLCGRKTFSFLWLLLIPAIMALTSLPMGIMQMNPLQIFKTFSARTGEWKKLTLNYPNLYALLEEGEEGYSLFAMAGVGLLGAVFCLAAGVLLKRRAVLQGKKILLVAAWSVLVCVYLLPSMHERYGLAGELLLLAYALIARSKTAWAAAGLCTLAIVNAYSTYLVAELFPVGAAVLMQSAAVLLLSRECYLECR